MYKASWTTSTTTNLFLFLILELVPILLLYIKKIYNLRLEEFPEKKLKASIQEDCRNKNFLLQ